jgi:hypothetical protein
MNTLSGEEEPAWLLEFRAALAAHEWTDEDRRNLSLLWRQILSDRS